MSEFLIHKIDENYRKLYATALKATQMEHSEERYARFYNLLQFYKQSLKLPNYYYTAEAGCWRGLSSYMMLQSSESHNKKDVSNHVIFDSFEGLSSPSEQDVGFYSPDEMKGRFACDLYQVTKNLESFNDRVTYVPGWIPESFKQINQNTQYKFVHIDVELFEPTYASLQYFYPQLVKGGIIVCDDCGYVSFPGSNRAMNQFCEETNIQPIYLTTGNGVIIK